MVNDDRRAYVAFVSTPAADANGECAPPGCPARMAIAPVPLGGEQVTAEACTAEWTLGDPTTAAYTPSQLVLDSSYVYVLADVGFSVPPRQVILRASR
jgi:hypothetical protein